MVVDLARSRVAAADNEHGQFDLVLHALADPTRRDIVRLVLREEHSVSNLARCYPMSFAAVQKHVAILERAALVTKHKHGRQRLVRGRIEAVREVARMFDQLETTWRDRLDRFGDVLAAPDTNIQKSTTKQGAKR